jgi:hypothetical protein
VPFSVITDPALIGKLLRRVRKRKPGESAGEDDSSETIPQGPDRRLMVLDLGEYCEVRHRERPDLFAFFPR